MTQKKTTGNTYSLGRNIADRLLASQGEHEFVRDVLNQTEHVSYPPDSTVRYWYNTQSETYPAHRHTACELILPVESNYIVTVSGRIWELAPGDIFVIPGGQLHALSAPGRGSRIIVLFEMDPILALPGSEPVRELLREPLLVNRSTCPQYYDAQMGLIDGISQAQLRETALRDMSIYLLLMNFFLNCCRARQNQRFRDPPPDAGIPNRDPTEKFQAVLAYIDQHFDENLTLEHAADVAGFSKYHFCRLFRRLYDCNFYDYLSQRRIRAAQELLTQSDLSVSQIALQSGFSSIATFNRTFAKLKGCTPTQYRSAARLDPVSNYGKDAHHGI